MLRGEEQRLEERIRSGKRSYKYGHGVDIEERGKYRGREESFGGCGRSRRGSARSERTTQQAISAP